MPNTIRSLSQFIPTGNPDTMAVAINSQTAAYIPYAAGDIGSSIELNDKTYSNVIVDSGATSATPIGTVAANQLLVWKDKAARLVTNDIRFAFLPGSPDLCVAGVARVAVGAPGTYGTQIMMLCKGYNVPVSAIAGTSEGTQLQLDTTASTNRAKAWVSGSISLGISRSGVTAGALNADIDIPVLP